MYLPWPRHIVKHQIARLQNGIAPVLGHHIVAGPMDRQRETVCWIAGNLARRARDALRRPGNHHDAKQAHRIDADLAKRRPIAARDAIQMNETVADGIDPIGEPVAGRDVGG